MFLHHSLFLSSLLASTLVRSLGGYCLLLLLANDSHIIYYNVYAYAKYKPQIYTYIHEGICREMKNIINNTHTHTHRILNTMKFFLGIRSIYTHFFIRLSYSIYSTVRVDDVDPFSFGLNIQFKIAKKNSHFLLIMERLHVFHIIYFRICNR